MQVFVVKMDGFQETHNVLSLTFEIDSTFVTKFSVLFMQICIFGQILLEFDSSGRVVAAPLAPFFPQKSVQCGDTY